MSAGKAIGIVAGAAAVIFGAVKLKAQSTGGDTAVMGDVPDLGTGENIMIHSGRRLSAAEIAQYAAAAGFSGDDLAVSVAIALAESKGDPEAYNPVTNLDSGKPANTPEGEGATGLWQIYRKVHPEFSDWDLKEPAQNAAAAFSVYRDAGYSFHPWTTFTNNAYQVHLGVAETAVNA